MKRNYAMCTALLAVLLMLPVCAKMQQPVPVAQGPGEKTVMMQADSYEFKPNNIRAEQGDTIAFAIDNISGSGHNFTIKDPRGQVLKSVELPSKNTVRFSVNFREPGVYDFFCNKPFHSTLGMKGRVEIGPR